MEGITQAQRESSDFSLKPNLLLGWGGGCNEGKWGGSERSPLGGSFFLGLWAAEELGGA